MAQAKKSARRRIAYKFLHAVYIYYKVDVYSNILASRAPGDFLRAEVGLAREASNIRGARIIVPRLNHIYNRTHTGSGMAAWDGDYYRRMDLARRSMARHSTSSQPKARVQNAHSAIIYPFTYTVLSDTSKCDGQFVPYVHVPTNIIIITTF